MRPGNRGVLILPGPLQALLGAAILSITVPGVVYAFVQSRWSVTTYLFVGAGAFLVYVVAYGLGLIKPYKP